MPEQRPYQQLGTSWLAKVERGILADEPGLGKTNQLLMAAEGDTLVVSPAMLEDVWSDEAMMWRPDLVDVGSLTWVSYSSLCGRGPDKQGRMTVPLTAPKVEYQRHWDTIILDESHYVKERKTRWTKAAQSLRTDQLFLATGTALPNWAHEIFTSLQLLFPSRARAGQEYGSYWRWIGKWFQTDQNRFAKMQGNAHARDIGGLWPHITWEEFALGNHLDGHWLRRLRDDVLPDLPPLDRQTIEIPLTEDQRRYYNQVRKEMYAYIEETGNEVVSWSKSGIHTKLMKMCTGVEVEDETYPKWGNKISAIRELMVGRTRPVVIFTMFRSTARQIYKALSQDGLSCTTITGDYAVAARKAHARDFQAGKADVLIGTFGAMAEGLTFTRADTVIFAERDPRPSKNEQAVRRIHRFGQQYPCLAIDLVSKGTVDVAMLKWLAEKSDQQMAAMTAFDLVQAA